MTTATLQDLTAPRVVGAQARELARVRVSFDEREAGGRRCT
jgi:hypothetical protein